MQSVFHDILEYASVITFLHINENQYEIMVYRLAFHPWKLRLQLSILQGQEAKGLHEEDQPSWNDVIGIPTCHIFFFFLQRPNRKSKSQYSKSVLCFKSIHQIFSKVDPYLGPKPTSNWTGKFKINPKLAQPKTGFRIICQIIWMI